MRILFVCVGNICRSPLAEYAMRRELEGRLETFWVGSAGISALEGSGAAEMTQQTAAEVGLDLSRHRGQQLTTELAESCDLILVMEGWQRPQVESFLRGKDRPQVRMLGEYAMRPRPLLPIDVADPYGGSRTDFERARDLIVPSVQELAREILERQGR